MRSHTEESLLSWAKNCLFALPYFVYVLLCADDTLYTGYTTDIGRRVEEHNTGSGAKYTRSRRPVRLVYKEEHRSRNDALKREMEIKNMRRSSKLLLCTGVHRLERRESPRSDRRVT